jgi:WD40 repeat protein/beta-lactamase regulating signal transducer with metallopeptidase domain
MTAPQSFLAGGLWALGALVQVSVVALLGLLAWLVARRRSPALRGAVLLAAIVGLLAVPVLAAVAPVWLPLPEWMCPAQPGPSARVPSVVVPPLPLPPPSVPVFAVRVPQRAADASLSTLDPANLLGETAGAKAEVLLVDDFSLTEGGEWRVARAEPKDAASVAAPPSPLATVASLLVTLWLLGALVCLVRALLGLVLLYRRALQARPVREREWTDLLVSLAQRHGLGAVALRESPAVTSPLTLGLFRPVILLPGARRHWPAGQRALVLAHELAHARRGDFLAGLLAELASCLCWFHPLVRWLAGRLRLEQEYAADAWVVSADADSMDYVRCLARLALDQGGGRVSLAPALWRRRPEILRRIDMLRCNPSRKPPRLDRGAAWMVALLAAAACVAVAGVGPLPLADRPAAAATPQDPDRAAVDPHGDALPAGALARLGTTRLRHGGDVTYVAFGADGKTLLTAGQDNMIRIWDLTSGTEVRRFVRPAALAPKPPAKPDAKDAKPQIDDILMAMGGQGGRGGFSVALAPSGKMLAATGVGVIQLWDAQTGKELQKIEIPGRNIVGMRFSPDTRTLAARTMNGTLLLWGTETGKLLHEIKPPKRDTGNGVVLTIGGGAGEPPGMAFTPDGKTLAAVGVDFKKEATVASVKFWDLASGKEVRKIPAPAGVSVSAIALSTDGKLLAYSDSNVVHICEADGGKQVSEVKISGNLSLAFTPDSKMLAVRNRNQRLRLCDVTTGKELHQLSDGEPQQQTGGLAFFIVGAFSGPETRAVAIAPDGKKIAAASGSTVRLWDVASGKELSLLEGHRRTPATIVLSPDGKTVVSWAPDRTVRRWEAGTGKPLGAMAAPAGTTHAAFSPDGRIVALSNADNTIRFHDTATGKELSQIKGRTGGTVAMAFAPEGKLLAARGNDDSIKLYDVARGTELRQINLRPAQPAGGGGGTVIFIGGPARSPRGTAPGLGFSPDGKLLVVPTGGGRGDPGNSLVIVDAVIGKELRKIASPQAIASYAFSPDSRTLAAENTDRTITLWEVASGKERAHLGKPAEAPPQDGGRMALTVDIDGIAGGSTDPAGPVGVTFSPDGRAIVVRGQGRSVRVWDVLAGKEIGELKGHSGRVETVAITADGKRVASGSADTTVLLWDVARAMKDLSRPQAVELTGTDVDGVWRDLAGEDAARALRGIRKIAGGPGQALPILGERLKPAARVDPKKITGWITDLESDMFTVRRASVTNLLKTGEQAVPILQKVLASAPPLETRKRLEELLDQLTSGELTAAQLRMVRAVEALERMDTGDARRLLQVLADGAPGALTTREAQSALARMTRDR